MTGEKVCLIVITIVVGGLLIFGTGYYYKHEQRIIKSPRNEVLYAIAGLKANQIAQKERLSEAGSFSKNAHYKPYTQSLIGVDYENIKKIKYSLAGILINKRYSNIFILDEFGKLIFSYDPDFNLASIITCLLILLAGVTIVWAYSLRQLDKTEHADPLKRINFFNLHPGLRA